jgi:hypothetical protein
MGPGHSAVALISGWYLRTWYRITPVYAEKYMTITIGGGCMPGRATIYFPGIQLVTVHRRDRSH